LNGTEKKTERTFFWYYQWLCEWRDYLWEDYIQMVEDIVDSQVCDPMNNFRVVLTGFQIGFRCYSTDWIVFFLKLNILI